MSALVLMGIIAEVARFVAWRAVNGHIYGLGTLGTFRLLWGLGFVAQMTVFAHMLRMYG